VGEVKVGKSVKDSDAVDEEVVKRGETAVADVPETLGGVGGGDKGQEKGDEVGLTGGVAAEEGFGGRFGAQFRFGGDVAGGWRFRPGHGCRSLWW
jgi:hypothetical protein